MKIVVFETEAREREALRRLESSHQVVVSEELLTAENAGQHGDAEIISPFSYSRLGEDVLEQMPNSRMIATRSIGIDHIDAWYCNKTGITLASVF